MQAQMDIVLFSSLEMKKQKKISFTKNHEALQKFLHRTLANFEPN